MYRIKYEKNRLGAVLRILLFVALILIGGAGALFAERILGERADGAETIREKATEQQQDAAAETQEVEDGPESCLREVWIKGIEISSYISENDIIDVRVVYYDGRDEKLLAEKSITGLDKNGVFLPVREEELEAITKAVMDLEGGLILKAYAVRIP